MKIRKKRSTVPHKVLNVRPNMYKAVRMYADVLGTNMTDLTTTAVKYGLMLLLKADEAVKKTEWYLEILQAIGKGLAEDDPLRAKIAAVVPLDDEDEEYDDETIESLEPTRVNPIQDMLDAVKDGRSLSDLVDNPVAATGDASGG